MNNPVFNQIGINLHDLEIWWPEAVCEGLSRGTTRGVNLRDSISRSTPNSKTQLT